MISETPVTQLDDGRDGALKSAYTRYERWCVTHLVPVRQGGHEVHERRVVLVERPDVVRVDEAAGGPGEVDAGALWPEPRSRHASLNQHQAPWPAPCTRTKCSLLAL